MNDNGEVLEVPVSPSSPVEEPPASKTPETVTPSTKQCDCETESATIKLEIPTKVTTMKPELVKEAETKDCKDESSAPPVGGAEGDRINTEAEGEVVEGESITEKERKAEDEFLVAPKKDYEVIDSNVHALDENDRESGAVKAEELTPIAEEHEMLMSETGSPVAEENVGEKKTVKVEELTPVAGQHEELRMFLAGERSKTEGFVVKVEEVSPLFKKGGKSSEGKGVESGVKSEDVKGEGVPPVQNACPIPDKADKSKGELGGRTVAKQDDGIEVLEETVQSNEPFLYLIDEDEQIEEAHYQQPDNSQLNGKDSLQAGTDSQLIGEDETAVAHTETGIEETESDVVKSGSGGKQKRIRNSKSQAKTPTRKTSEEDVCFICLDGGELVLCDRRGCPKAYHPSCVNRDEAFFQTKGLWICGWHICSTCQQNAYYMCYTCTFSLCKGCVKDAEFSCVRGNKGLCEACMKTVMLVEKKDLGNDDTAILNDESSWEYLFKDYWKELKGKLSLTSDELALAKNTWKESAARVPAGVHDADNEGQNFSDTSMVNVETFTVKRKMTKKRLRSATMEDDSDTDSSFGKPSASYGKRHAKRSLKSEPKEVDSYSDYSLGDHNRSTNQRTKAKKQMKSHSVGVGIAETGGRGNSQWVSKELLNFVMLMKNGDKSIPSQLVVQELLFEYIKRNKLRDPHRRSHIVCDPMLQKLFGKPRVGHFEMLKLLESHFLLKEDSQADDYQGSAVNNEDAETNVDHLADTWKLSGKKLRRRGSDNRGFQSNVDDYAAIDVHNISLIYLRRNLIEALMKDSERFHDTVVGCFVRIRISASTQKQDVYRLVQVIGTSKAAGPYKVGKRTTDDLLEILNLDKTEVISIDTVSNQDLREEECKRLRQSIKCGIISLLMVGDILDKAKELQAVRVKDWLETEILRISHLRDRASDLGRKKELRECVEKLQILKTPEEQQWRLDEIPEVHADPTMDPNYDSESEADDRNQESERRSTKSEVIRRGKYQFSRKGSYDFNDSWAASAKPSSKKWDMNKKLSGNDFSSSRECAVGVRGTPKRELGNQGVDTSMCRLISGEKSRIVSDTVTGKQAEYSGKRTNLSPDAALEASHLPCSAVTEPETKISETDKLWHYRDPSAKVQGPFSMTQLRKWSNNGYFPSDMQIWRTAQSEDQSILLTEALAGRFQKDPCMVGASLTNNPGLQASRASPANTGNPQNMYSQCRANADRTNTLKINQDLGSGNAKSSLHSSSRSIPAMARSLSDTSSKVGTPSFSDTCGSDYGGKNDSSNLPSPTPKRTKSRWSTPSPHQQNSDVLESTTAGDPEGREYTDASCVASHETMKGAQQSSREAAAVLSASIGSSYSSLPGPGISSLANWDNSFNSTSANDPQMPLQTFAGQNPPNYYQGWGPSYLDPMPAQQPAYDQWSDGITSATFNAGQTAAFGHFFAADFQGVASANPWVPQMAVAPQNVWAMAVPTYPGAAHYPFQSMGWVGAAQGVCPVGAAFGPSQGEVFETVGGLAGAPTAAAQGLMPGNTNMVWPNTVQVPLVGNMGEGWVALTGNPGNSGT